VAGEPEPAQPVRGRQVGAAERAQGPGEQRDCGGVAVGNQQCEAVEQQVRRPAGVGRRAGEADGPPGSGQAFAVGEASGDQRGGECFEIGLASQARRHRLELAGGPEQQRGRAPAMVQGERDPSAQQNGPGPLRLSQSSGFRRVKQGQRRVVRAGLLLGLGGGQGPFGPAVSVEGEGGRTLKERRCRRCSPAGPGPV
jgi:hypothetical protein